MPHGKRRGSKKASNKRVSNKISKLRHEGKPQKQAVAIALSMERRRKSKSGGRKGKHG